MNIVFAGTPEFAAHHLAGLISAGINITAVVTQPDKPGKRGNKLVASAVKQVAQANGLPILQPVKVTAADLSPYQPDLLVVVAYGQILRQDLLDLPTYGCINVHGSLLPNWRGAAPIQRSIEAGDETTGICIMQMDAGLDTGPVLLKLQLPIESDDTAGTMSDKLAILGVDGLLQVIEQIKAGVLKPEDQPAEGSYAKKISKQEARIDWTAAATNIVRKVHAFNPDPVCFTMCPFEESELRLKVYRGIPNDEVHNKTPGEVVAVTSEGVTVAAGSGFVTISQLQIPLGKGSILSGRDIKNSRTDILFPGLRFN